MSRIQNNKAIVLYYQPYRSSSRLVWCLTPEGVIPLVAKGVELPNASVQNAYLQPLFFTEIWYYPKATRHFFLLKEVLLLYPKPPFWEKESLFYSYFTAELLYQWLKPHVPEPEVFHKSVEYVHHFHRYRFQQHWQFWCEVLRLLGYSVPNVNGNPKEKVQHLFEYSKRYFPNFSIPKSYAVFKVIL